MTTERTFMMRAIRSRRPSCLSTMCLISGIKCRAGNISSAETKRLSLRDLRTYLSPRFNSYDQAYAPHAENPCVFSAIKRHKTGDSDESVNQSLSPRNSHQAVKCEYGYVKFHRSRYHSFFLQTLSCASRNNFNFINDFSRRDCVLRYVWLGRSRVGTYY